ncbi:hypothetical protein C8Q80DRAFT_1271104 [Daedaleopsis nitida]|nr:hypothetical protein C8Q80DRAFT_1271104 [Daedaleopsis nitida]
MSAKLPRLNVDIIREISTNLPLSACASLMRTSWFFYHETAKVALRHIVYLFDTQRVELFARFVCAEDGRRFRYVREVHIGADGYEISYPTLQWLSKNIPRMTSLTTIGLADEDGLDFAPELYAAIASLVSLRHLRIGGAGPMSASLLSVSRSKLQSAYLFSKSCDTLEKLDSHEWYTPRNMPVSTIVYPKIREFSFSGDDYPLILPYVRAFPNLAWLSLEDINYRDLLMADMTGGLITRLQEHHALNVKSQMDAGTWNKLEQLVGSITDLYIFAPICHIDRLDLINDVLGSQKHRFHDMLFETLPFARPKQLQIISGSGALLLHPTSSLAAILQTPAGSRLENLVLNIDLDENDSEGDVAAALNSFAERLTQICSLRRLRLRVWGFSLRISKDSASGSRRELITRAERSLQTFDAAQYARSFAAATPPLEDVVAAIMDIREMEDVVATPAGIVPKDDAEHSHDYMSDINGSAGTMREEDKKDLVLVDERPPNVATVCDMTRTRLLTPSTSASWASSALYSRVNLRTSIRSEHDLEILSEVLAYARPKELKIEGDATQILHTDNSFPELLRTAAGSCLENLLLPIDLSTSDRKVDIAAALERLGAALRACPLRRLRLCVRAGRIDPTPLPRRSRAASLRRSGGEMPQSTASDPPSPPIPLNLAERSLQAFDIAAYSSELGSAIASLTDAVFMIAGLRNDETMLSYIPPRAAVDPKEERTYDWEL